jgi:hypothetical protein
MYPQGEKKKSISNRPKGRSGGRRKERRENTEYRTPLTSRGEENIASERNQKS